MVKATAASRAKRYAKNADAELRNRWQALLLARRCRDKAMSRFQDDLISHEPLRRKQAARQLQLLHAEQEDSELDGDVLLEEAGRRRLCLDEDSSEAETEDLHTYRQTQRATRDAARIAHVVAPCVSHSSAPSPRPNPHSAVPTGHAIVGSQRPRIPQPLYDPAKSLDGHDFIHTFRLWARTSRVAEDEWIE